MNEESLTINSDPSGDEVRLAVTGDVDMTTAPALADALRSAERSAPGAIVVDLRHLSFIDSTGLQVLLSTAHRCGRAQRDLSVVNVPDHIRRLFALVALDRTLTVA